MGFEPTTPALQERVGARSDRALVPTVGELSDLGLELTMNALVDGTQSPAQTRVAVTIQAADG